MVPAAEWIGRPSADASGSVPYVLTAGSDNVLARAIVDDRAIGAARRCLERWRRLQEAGGIRDSHAERLIEREKKIWEEQKRQELASSTTTAAPIPAIALSAATTQAEPAAATAQRSADEAYIETERCSTCNECTQINDRMFAYNGNKQAYIADIRAGSYAQLVEAAESCQLGIIHPGKPIDQAEPGLDDLIKRAEPFL